MIIRVIDTNNELVKYYEVMKITLVDKDLLRLVTKEGTTIYQKFKSFEMVDRIFYDMI